MLYMDSTRCMNDCTHVIYGLIVFNGVKEPDTLKEENSTKYQQALNCLVSLV